MLCVFVVRDARLYVGMVHVREATLRVLSLLLGHTARGIFDTPQLLTVGAPRSDTTKRKTADGSLTSKILSEMVRGKKAKYENGWAGRCVLPVKVIYLWGGGMHLKSAGSGWSGHPSHDSMERPNGSVDSLMWSLPSPSYHVHHCRPTSGALVDMLPSFLRRKQGWLIGNGRPFPGLLCAGVAFLA